MQTDPKTIKIILVGVRDFDDENLHSLPATYDNVAELYSIFSSDHNALPKENITKFHGDSKSDILKSISKVTNTQKTTLLVLYYAGHGIYDEEESEFYLTTKKTNLNEVHIESISISELNRTINKSVKKTALILDCCYSEQAFEFLANKRNYFVMASSPKTETSKYPEGSKYSAFTNELVNVLRNGLESKSQFLTFNDIFRVAKERLAEKGFPSPKKVDRNEVEEFIIAKNVFRAAKVRKSGSTGKITSYTTRLKASLSKHKVKYFIELEIIDKAINGKETNNLISPNKTAYCLNDIPRLLERGVLAILGPPGAGKTTLLSKFSSENISTTNLITFVRMGLYRPSKSLFDLIDLQEFTTNEKTELLKSGRLIIVFDGVNEAPRENLDRVFGDINDFIESYPGNRFLISCRTSEFPDWVREFYLLLSVQPISEADVERQFISSFGEVQGAYIFNEFVAKQEIEKFKEVCQNPMLLSMFISVYKTLISEKAPGEYLNLRFTRTELYSLFINKYEYRERIKRIPFPIEKVLFVKNIREDIISYISYLMNDRLFVKKDELFALLAEGYNVNFNNVFDFKANGIKVSDIFRSITSQLPFKVIENFEDEPNEYTYIHQSFHEYYYALYLAKEFDRNFVDFSALTKLVSDSSRRKWEILIFLVGLSSKSREIVGHIITLAKQLNNQSYFLLASKCTKEASSTNIYDADDLIIRMIEAFKYWDIPFDYELIHGIKETMVQKSAEFPDRITKDLEWFVEKYAQYTPVNLRSHSTSELFALINGADLAMAIDAAFTLGKKGFDDQIQKDEVVYKIIGVIYEVPAELREHLVIALKELKSELSIKLLEGIVKDTKEKDQTRGYALNALGAIGSLDSIDTIVGYLLNHTNKYRDSASWSLQQLGLKAREADERLFTNIKRIYWEALINETTGQAAISAKGNLLYSLSKLDAKEYADRIIEFLNNESDEYVLEDGINAVGVLGGQNAVVFLLPFLDSGDPLIKVKAIEALTKLREKSAIPKIQEIAAHDKYASVREAAISSLQNLLPVKPIER